MRGGNPRSPPPPPPPPPPRGRGVKSGVATRHSTAISACALHHELYSYKSTQPEKHNYRDTSTEITKVLRNPVVSVFQLSEVNHNEIKYNDSSNLPSLQSSARALNGLIMKLIMSVCFLSAFRAELKHHNGIKESIGSVCSYDFVWLPRYVFATFSQAFSHMNQCQMQTMGGGGKH